MERPTKMEETTNHSWLEANVFFFSYFWLHLKKVWKYLTVSFFYQESFFLGGTFSEILESMTNRSSDFVWNFPPFGDGEVAGISCCASLQGGHLLIC